LPAWFGSDASFEALTFDAVSVPAAPEIACAAAKASFAGGGADVAQLSVTLPKAPTAPVAVPRQPSTAIWYVVPAVTPKVTLLCCCTPYSMSSSLATAVSALTPEPL
jgi:hypothetical protein